MSACYVCLQSEPDVRLTQRDLTDFSNVCTALHNLDIQALLCQYCWTRASQCAKFVKLVGKSQHSLGIDIPLNVKTKHHPYTIDRLEDTNVCEECSISFPAEVKSENTFENIDFTDTLDNENFNYEESECADINFDTKSLFAVDIGNESNVDDVLCDLNNGQAEFDAAIVPRRKKSKRNDTQSIKEQTESYAPIKTHRKKLKRSNLDQCKKGNNLKSATTEESKAASYGLQLVELTLDEQKDEIERRKETARYKTAKFKCEKCGLNYQTEENYKIHVSKFHSEAAGAHECSICRYRFKSHTRLATHTREVHARKWRCLRCSAVIGKVYWYQHRNKCVEEQQLECDICGKIYKTKIRLQNHKSRYHNAKRNGFKCDICSKSYTRKTALMTHMRHHTGEKPYECEVCGMKFIAFSYYKIHFDKKHGAPREPEPPEERYCVECDRHFKSKSILDMHLSYTRKHGTNDRYKHECDTCHKRFIVRHQLLDHVKMVHIKIKDFSCSQCDKAFTTKNLLRLHFSRVHKPKQERQRKHACAVCSAAFTDKQGLKIHTTAVHEKLRPYECDVCGADFGFFSALYTHKKKKHGGVRSDAKSFTVVTSAE